MCQNFSSGHPSSSEQPFHPLLHVTCLPWVSVSLTTSGLCSNPLLSTFVPCSRLLSLAASAPHYFHDNASCECVLRPSFGCAAGFVSFLLRDNSSSGFRFAPELSDLPLCHVGCLRCVPALLRTPVLSSDSLLTTSLFQQSFVSVYVPPAALSFLS